MFKFARVRQKRGVDEAGPTDEQSGFQHRAPTYRRGMRVENERVCSDYAKSMEGKRAKCVRKLGGGEEDKGGDLLPKLLSMPLLPAHRLLAPNLLWVLVIGRARVVGEEL